MDRKGGSAGGEFCIVIMKLDGFYGFNELKVNNINDQTIKIWDNNNTK